MKAYNAYILFSQSLNKYYIGHTQELSARIQRHNSGQVKWTKRGIPWNLAGSFNCKTKTEAVKLEIQIKNRSAKRYLESRKIKV